MRTYQPHDNDRRAATQALHAIATRQIHASVDEQIALKHVLDTRDGDTVTQRTICRAHDAIDRMYSMQR